MTPQEIEWLRIEGLKDKVLSLSAKVEILKADVDALTTERDILLHQLNDSRSSREGVDTFLELVESDRDFLLSALSAFLDCYCPLSGCHSQEELKRYWFAEVLNGNELAAIHLNAITAVETAARRKGVA